MNTAALVLSVLTAAAPTPSADESYVIRLSRPSRVGDRYRVDARGVQRTRQQASLGEKALPAEDKELSVHLVAIATVLAVDSKFSVTRGEYKIESFRSTSAGKTEELLPAGRRVVAESKNGETAFTTDGAEQLTAETLEALNMVISVHDPESPTDDDVFGTRARKRVGETWSMDSATAAREFSKSGLSVAADDLKGTARLVAVKDVRGVKALEVSASFRAQNLKLGSVQEGVTQEKAVMEGDFSGLFPADPQSRSMLSETVRMRLNVVMGGRKADTGEKITVEASMETNLEKSYSPADGATQSQVIPKPGPELTAR